MSKIDVIRAWKDDEYRSSLSERHRAAVPDNPAGALDLSEGQLDIVAGGVAIYTFGLGCGGGTTGDYFPCPSDLFQICTFDFICPILPVTQ